MRQHKYDYDAFISHAVEDKIPIANELCVKLERAGLRIWYSGKELGIGDSIEKTIENGLNRSRYGIVILSPTYLAKNWTIREFYTLLAKEIEEQKVILPVLYNITLDELKKRDMLMADRFAVNADRGVDHIVEHLVREIRKPKHQKAKVAWFSRIWAVLILSLLANIALVVKDGLSQRDSRVFLEYANKPDRQMMNANLLDEMQGLFTQLSVCTCNYSKLSGRSTAVRPRMVNNHLENAQIRAPENPVQENAIPRRNRGKMTMSVVFQIEGPSEIEPAPDIEKDVDEMMETITIAGESPFIAVSNRDTRDQMSEQICRHAE